MFQVSSFKLLTAKRTKVEDPEVPQMRKGESVQGLDIRHAKANAEAFGNMSYDQSMSQYDFEYQVYDLKDSIERTEG